MLKRSLVELQSWVIIFYDRPFTYHMQSFISVVTIKSLINADLLLFMMLSSKHLQVFTNVAFLFLTLETNSLTHVYAEREDIFIKYVDQFHMLTLLTHHEYVIYTI